MLAMAFNTSRAGNATGLMRSLCSLMPISITLVSCSSSHAAAAAAGTSSSGGSSRGFALKARGGASEEEASTPVCSPRDSGTNKHSFRSMGHPAVPDALRLKQVVVICRHGDRAPVSSSLGKILDDGPDSVKLWNSKLPPQEELDRWNEAFPPRVLGDSLGQTIEEIASAEGPWGQLTSRGAEELRLVGEGLRGVLEAGGDEGVGGEGSLFPAGLEAEKSAIFVRCTRLKRTHQSAQNMLEGLGLRDGVDLYVRPPERETLWPSKRNRRKQDRLIARAIAESTFPGQAELKTKTAEMVGVPEDDVKWTTVREVLSCYEAHGVALPAGAISSGLVEGVVDYTGWMWGRWFEQREMTRLSLGPFLAELLTLVGARGHETGVPEAGMPSTPKLAIFSGHDSTLVPILTALKIYDDVWPPYASYITLDVAEEEQGGGRLVRVVFNGREAVLPGAKGPWVPLLELQERRAGRCHAHCRGCHRQRLG
ncbi:unnamed protein product [Ectocarpus sp. CCAP 1310/34]|nr:unnamed protein product [Ectocarpus sp. CCAP 1310/34]